MNFYQTLTPIITGISILIVQTDFAVALSPTDVGKIAKEITVILEHPQTQGSGVIIKKEGNIYTVITSSHVLTKTGNYTIISSDGKRYPTIKQPLKRLSGVDLAVVQFSSNENYKIAKIGDSSKITAGAIAYVAGFPKATAAISSSVYTFTEGKITGNASKPLKDGYALVYSNNTLPGMSGGAVLNEKAELIGIHGRADLSVENIKTASENPNIALKSGFNLGIPINTFVRQSSTVGVNLGISTPAIVATAPKADDFYIQAGEKSEKGDFRGAIVDYTEAIRLNPNYTAAYKDRGVTYFRLKERRLAITDFNQAIKLNSNDAEIYNHRGITRYEIGDKQGAIRDYSQAIKINPKLHQAYINRAVARGEIGDKAGADSDYSQAFYLQAEDKLERRDFQGAIAKYTEAIRLNSNYAAAYQGRGIARFRLGEKESALADLNQAIKLNPDDAKAYYERGIVRNELGDKQGAINDYNQAIKINPKFDQAYINRGTVRGELGDKKGETADYNQATKITPDIDLIYSLVGRAFHDGLGDKKTAIDAYEVAIKLNPNNADAYYDRGNVRRELGDKEGAIRDFNQAIKINPKNAQAYFARASLRRDLGNKKGAISDFQEAAKLFQRQGDNKLYQEAVNEIKKTQ